MEKFRDIIELPKELLGVDTNLAGFDPNQKRNPDGTWGDGGGSIEDWDDKIGYDICIGEYTSSEYYEINNYLRNSKSFISDEGKETIECLKEMLSKNKEKNVSYRGMSIAPWKAEKMVKDLQDSGEIKFPAFLSTSKDRQIVIDGYSGNKGAKDIIFVLEGTSGSDISKFSSYQDELEVLYPPDTEWKLIDINLINNGYEIRIKEK